MSEDFFQNEEFESIWPAKGRIYTVSEITREIKFVLEEGFPSVWVEGEISNLKKHMSGHLYFSIKDPEAQISCVMWRGRNQALLFQPQDGMKVRVFGNLTVYERQGRYQLDVLQLRPAGRGELQQAFEALKERLDKEGLFCSERKRSLPPFPERIGLVTSPTGAAIRDIMSVIGRRFPSVQLIIRPVRVQGEGAAEEIAEAIAELNAHGQADVLIVGRGGGSLEDLWAFNEEVVARAIFNSKIPVVSAVGHEIDFSISDFVADVRAPTPSAAAELVVKDREELLQTIFRWEERLVRILTQYMESNRDRLDSVKRSHGFRWPSNRVREYRLRMDDVSRNLETAVSHRMDGLHSAVLNLKGRLAALNPEDVLRRGYSITTRIRDGRVIVSSSDVTKNEKVRSQFARGSVLSKIEEIEESEGTQ